MISASDRRTVRTIYAFACGYCGISEVEVGAHLTIDHFIPRDAGGTDDVGNLVYACHACNLHKSAAWNAHEPVVLHPGQTDMNLHIRPRQDGAIEGLTPEGNRPLATLRLNRPLMVERRKMRILLQGVMEYQLLLLERGKRADREARIKADKIRGKRRKKP